MACRMMGLAEVRRVQDFHSLSDSDLAWDWQAVGYTLLMSLTCQECFPTVDRACDFVNRLILNCMGANRWWLRISQ